ncbi:hypothetical protein BKA81DRAFT_166552 [Phyllosticta paracitricarpa]
MPCRCLARLSSVPLRWFERASFPFASSLPIRYSPSRRQPTLCPVRKYGTTHSSRLLTTHPPQTPAPRCQQPASSSRSFPAQRETLRPRPLRRARARRAKVFFGSCRSAGIVSFFNLPSLIVDCCCWCSPQSTTDGTCLPAARPNISPVVVVVVVVRLMSD